MAQSSNLGFPRIGRDRELKKATEGYWSGSVSADDLLSIGRRLRAEQWREQAEAGIGSIPSNTFSFYDHVLDTVALVGAVPDRYLWRGEEVDLDTYFAMARGAQGERLDVQAMEMTKWFDTNYHYIVPEFVSDQTFRLGSTKPFDEFREAREIGIETRPVLLGPVSFLLLGKPRGGEFSPLETHLESLLGVYAEVVKRLVALGAREIQFDEPCFVEDRTAEEIAALDTAYRTVAAEAGDAELIVQTYFDHVGAAFSTIVNLPVAGVGFDLVRGRETLDLIAEHGFPIDKKLVAGVVDGRNVWVNDYAATLELLSEVLEAVDAERLVVGPSCSLIHVPIEAARETELDDELRSWLSFATEKLAEIRTLTTAINEGREAVSDALAANGAAIASRASSERTRNPVVRERRAALDVDGAGRGAAFESRRAEQSTRLELPILPTTVIGSFPQHPEVRVQRRRFLRGEISRAEYEKFLEGEVRQAIELQESIGVDVPVHGEFERNDMVEYFGERLDGYAFTRWGWVQSFGSRYVKPPLLYGDVQRPQPMTVRWWKFAQSCTERPIKGMLTGPVTMLQWSFVRDDQPRSETCLQLAMAIGDEVQDLEAAGARVIQVDEPALREGLPLRSDGWDAYLRWAVAAFRVTTGGVGPGTQIHTHMCYSEFNDFIDHIERMDADVLLIENARSDEELLEVFREVDYGREIGPGVYDIHSPRVPPVEELANAIRASIRVLPSSRLWVNPDCGLKTRTYDEVVPALENMVAAAHQVREEEMSK